MNATREEELEGLKKTKQNWEKEFIDDLIKNSRKTLLYSLFGTHNTLSLVHSLYLIQMGIVLIKHKRNQHFT